ncbi:hypothetical protein EMIHUDRAFT_255630, partial [Emiliania huxleyi CCMP1516]|uniref:Uncharacterized protein n=2 Tax=Emiliania huxleyi TaxID=2903 RepID=A0A0D3J7Z6_EMIH1
MLVHSPAGHVAVGSPFDAQAYALPNTGTSGFGRVQALLDLEAAKKAAAAPAAPARQQSAARQMPSRVDADRGSSSSITGLIGAEMTDHVRVLEDAPEPPQALATETPVRRGATSSKNPSFVEEAEGPADWLLVLAKCTVPALFVAASGAAAIPVNNALGDGEGAEFFRKARSHHVGLAQLPFTVQASEEFAGGALIVTYAIELSQGYITKKDGALSRKLVAATLIGTIFSGQLQALGQALWPH